MEAFFVSITTVALAEMGDRTQLLSLLLAARFRRPWPILAGILLATLANHGVAGALGAWIGHLLTPDILDFVVGLSMLAMAFWTLVPDKLTDNGLGTSRADAFFATLVGFFIAEIGDKTQIATVALGAAYGNLAAVVGGTTIGMLLANAPVVFIGKAFADRLPMRSIHLGASLLFAALGLLFIVRAAYDYFG